MPCVIINTEINYSVAILIFEISSDQLQKVSEICTIRCRVQLAIHVSLDSRAYNTKDSDTVLNLIQWYFYDLIFF